MPMGVLRSALLRASQSSWLATRVPRWSMTRRAVRKFMPGETLAEALDAAQGLAADGIGAIVTELGENVTTRADAEGVARRYRETIDECARRGLDAEPSVKPTHLGCDIGWDGCEALTLELAAHAARSRTVLWIDMEGTAYTDRTIALYRKVRERFPTVGLALQAYLRRTPQDLAALLPLHPTIRLVKGAYAEPASLAFPSKGDVDRQYLALARSLLEAKAAGGAVRVVCGTHDLGLVGRIQGAAQAMTVLASAIGPVFLAQWVETAGSYAAAFYALSAVVAALAIAAALVPIPAGAAAAAIRAS